MLPLSLGRGAAANRAIRAAARCGAKAGDRRFRALSLRLGGGGVLGGGAAVVVFAAGGGCE